MEEIEGLYDFDELKMYFGEDYWVTDKIRILQPTIGDILDFGDAKFYSVVNTLIANPTSFRLMLWRAGIDWNNISDFDLFCSLITRFTPNDTKLLFGDLNLSWFMKIHDDLKDANILVYIDRNDDGSIKDIAYKDAIVIDEIIYTKMVKYIRKMFNIYPKIERAKNKATKEAMIWEEEENLKIQERKHKDEEISRSVLLPLVSAMVNHPGFKYKKKELREVGIVEFMDSVQRLQTYEQCTALLKGVYSGFVNSKDLKPDDMNWLKDLSNST